MKIDRELMTRLLQEAVYGDSKNPRLTQDSPVLPNVWSAYADAIFDQRSDGAVDLLLTPHKEATPARLAQALSQVTPGRARLSVNDSYVVGKFSFLELIREVLPLSGWFSRYLWRGEALNAEAMGALDSSRFIHLGLSLYPFDGEEIVRALLGPPSSERDTGTLAPDLVWFVRIVGLIQLAISGTDLVAVPWHRDDPFDVFPQIQGARQFVDAFRQAVEGTALHREPLLWLVNLNRRGGVALWRSRETVKADVAERSFACDFDGLRWAVIDTGIDATHPAFRRRAKDGAPEAMPFKPDNQGRWLNQTTIVETYDFTRLRDYVGALPGDPALAALTTEQLAAVEHLQADLKSGRAINWDALKPLLRVRHEDGAYEPPKGEHGTHVAGIIAGDWRASDPGMPESHDLRGVSPGMLLYDLRVFGSDLTCEEFAVTSALQFIRFLNTHADQPIVHGVNLSISMPAEVANYACGRTPVCDECERVVSAGIVAVAAAGNVGYQSMLAFQPGMGFADITITDPGNAAGVITVGATHRSQPHTYGVSYFSSRGPTADGRSKPDLIAPGEKITGPVPGAASKALDGTSMAAPHVSGAAATVMARHRELIGQPARIKRILMDTATDLGRQRDFQGAGLVDIYRALQSV